MPGCESARGRYGRCKRLCAWAQNGGLQKAIGEKGENVEVDGERVMMMGMSAGGHLALTTVSSFIHVTRAANTHSPHQ